jgi:hypothetical protein
MVILNFFCFFKVGQQSGEHPVLKFSFYREWIIDVVTIDRRTRVGKLNFKCVIR